MTALIIFLARRRHGRMPLAPLSPIDVALDHIIWLRITCPNMSPRQAAAMIGYDAWSWAEVVQAFAAVWEALRNEGNP